MKTYLLTGGSGFFGTVLKRRLLADGHCVVNVDIHPEEDRHPNLEYVRADIADRAAMTAVFEHHHYDGVLHVAAMLAHAVKDSNRLWESNVTGTEVVADLTRKHSISNLVFTSSNCLWGNAFSRPVKEDDRPKPVEVYGRSKWEGEKVLARYASDVNIATIRCPTIIDSGRLGLLAILFEFIHDGRRVWTVGDGSNRYQFIYAQDLADAACRAVKYPKSSVFNIGSDRVSSLRESYEYVIRKAGSSSRVAQLPRKLSLGAMRLAHHLKVSPLGPYHYKMIAENFVFDTTRIKSALGWEPTLSNDEMLWRAYAYFASNREEIHNRKNVSAHKQGARMGVIRLLKWVS